MTGGFLIFRNNIYSKIKKIIGKRKTPEWFRGLFPGLRKKEGTVIP
jgi:hypothetical protein